VTIDSLVMGKLHVSKLTPAPETHTVIITKHFV